MWLLFSRRDEFNIKVLQAFVELHEFADLNLVQALRWEKLLILPQELQEWHIFGPVEYRRFLDLGPFTPRTMTIKITIKI